MLFTDRGQQLAVEAGHVKDITSFEMVDVRM